MLWKLACEFDLTDYRALLGATYCAVRVSVEPLVVPEGVSREDPRFRDLRLLKTPLDEMIDRLKDRLFKIWTPNLALDFWQREHPDLGYLSPREAASKGRIKDVDRLIRRYEREAKAMRQ